MTNPLLSPSTLPFSLPDYASLTDAHVREALEVGMGEQLEALRTLADVGSTGERTMAAVVLSLAGEGVVDLSRLDALDPLRRELLADALVVLAGFRPG